MIIKKKVTSLETLNEIMKTNIKDVNKKHDSLDCELISIKSDLKMLQKEKIGKTQFYWILGIVFTIMSGMFGYLIDQVSDVKETTVNTRLEVVEAKADVSWIKLELENAEEISRVK